MRPSALRTAQNWNAQGNTGATDRRQSGRVVLLLRHPWCLRAFVPSCLLCFSLLAAGCVTITPPAAAPATDAEPPLPRPVIVIGGFVDPIFTATHVASHVRRETGETRVLAVHPGWLLGFDDAAEMVVDAVEKHFPSADPDETIEVDVIGISMGGLTARHAAAPGGASGKRLNIRRLYTTGAPHSGAQAANFFGIFGTAAAMRSTSPFLARLAEREQRTAEDDYEIVAWARGRDLAIGSAGLKLPEHLEGEFIHYPQAWYTPSHLWVYRDGRILRDIVKRLEEEELSHQDAKGRRDGETAADEQRFTRMTGE